MPTDVAEQGNITVVPGPTFEKNVEGKCLEYSLCCVDIAKEGDFFLLVWET